MSNTGRVKRASVLFPIFVIIAMVAAACGSSGADAPAQSAATAVPATSVPPTATVGPTGTLEVRVTDQPADDPTEIVLTVENVEVHRSGGDDTSGWQMVAAGPFEFDLLKLDGIEEILGDAELEVGRYQQIRLDVVSGRVQIQNGNRPIGVPSDKLRIVGGFEVVEGETTIVTLDFDAQRSIVFVPMRGPTLRPVVKLLIRSGGQSLGDANEVANLGPDGTSTAVERPTETPRVARPGFELVRVGVPTATNLQFMAFWTALGAGYFDDEGLDIQVVIAPSPMATPNFLLQGRTDIAVLPPPMFIPRIQLEEPIVIFGDLLQNDQINLVIRPEIMAERGLSVDMTVEERLRGISGLKIGVAHGPPTRLRVLFDSVGLDADSDIEMVVMSPEEENQAYEDGLVDGLYAHTPFLERALVNQGAVILINQSAGEVPALGGVRQSHALVTTRDFAGSDRDVLVKFTRAIARGQVLARTDVAATVEALFNAGIPDLERDLVETIVAIYSLAIPEAPAVSVAGVERAVELFPAHLAPPDLSGIDLSLYLDTTVWEEAR